jgi:hypothetical protein
LLEPGQSSLPFNLRFRSWLPLVAPVVPEQAPSVREG